MIVMVPVHRVKCRCCVRQFAQQRSAAVLMDRVQQTCESLLTQTKAKRTRGAMRRTSKKFIRRKYAGVGKFVRVTSLRKIERLFVMQDP